MIVRKPYAFLIKNFRLIHFFMLLLAGYLLYRTNIAYNFFDDYSSTRQFIESSTLIHDTVPIIIIIFAFILTFMSISIIILFRKKDKPTLFYIASVIFYVALSVLLIFSRNAMTTIILEGIDPRISRLLRDMWLIALILQIALVSFYLIRALGFDIKKFNFGEDIHQFQIEAEDNEEIELVSKFDKDKAKIKAQMQKEELRAFYAENKAMIIAILVILIVVIPGVFAARYLIANKKYSENEIIKLGKFELKIVDTYLTKKDYKGNQIFKNDNSFLVVKFNINNLVEEQRGIILNYLRVEANDTVYRPNLTYYEKLKDLGTGYNGQEISNTSKDYIAVYVIKDSDINNKMMVRYADRLTVKDNEVNALYYRVIIDPENLDSTYKTVNIDMNQSLQMNKENLKITRLSIKDKFTYEVGDKTKYIINSLGLVMAMDYEFSGDMNVVEFLKNYGSLRYTANGKKYTEDINIITPSGYNTDTLYLAINENIKDAESINLVLKLRNIEYIYNLMEKNEENS